MKRISTSTTIPLFGLVGTFFGIFIAFQNISESKATGLDAVAGGISEALLFTAGGMGIAYLVLYLFGLYWDSDE